MAASTKGFMSVVGVNVPCCGGHRGLKEGIAAQGMVMMALTQVVEVPVVLEVLESRYSVLQHETTYAIPFSLADLPL